jgi:hypothetical protein
MARLLGLVLSVLAATLLSSGSVNAATCYQFASKVDYPNCIQLDANLVLYWNTLDNQTLKLAADGDGYMKWVAIGISEAGMKGVDFAVASMPNAGSSWVIG